MNDPSGLESLYNWTRSLIKSGMGSGEIALLAGEAVVLLRYIDDSEKMILPVAAVIAPDQNDNNVLWALVALAALLALLALLAASRLRRRKKKEDEDKAFHKLDDDRDIITVPAYNFDGFSDVSSARRSDGSSLPSQATEKRSIPPLAVPVQPKSKESKALPIFRQSSIRPPPPHTRTLTPLDIEGIEDFMDHRFGSHEEELVLPDTDPPHCALTTPPERSKKGDFGNSGFNEHVTLKHVELRPAKGPAPPDDDEQAYTYEAMGRNRGYTPKCSICYKDADGWMRSCQCGSPSCDKIAHAICIDGRYPTPSVSYPGTPPPILPPILCGSENISWLNRSRSRTYDEENSVQSTLSSSHSVDESISETLMRGGGVGCMGCRD
jgi:hypothetical protein